MVNRWSIDVVADAGIPEVAVLGADGVVHGDAARGGDVLQWGRDDNKLEREMGGILSEF